MTKKIKTRLLELNRGEFYDSRYDMSHIICDISYGFHAQALLVPHMPISRIFVVS